MTKETNYTIEKRKDRLAIYKDGKCKAHGLLDERSALHAIWVVEGSNASDFYTYENNKVWVCTEKK